MLRFITPRNSQKSILVFVHGFIGGADTWTKEDNTKTILNYLMDDVSINSEFDFAVFEYYTSLSDIFQKIKVINGLLEFKLHKLKRNLQIDNISRLLKSELDVKCKQYDHIILIAHSMGGIVSKSYILSEIRQNGISPVSLFISLAVPHRGAELASLGKIILKNKQIKDLGPLSKIINTLNDEWNDVSQLPTTIYFRGLNDYIVTQESAVGISKGKKIIIDSDDDHFSILKPESNEHVVLEAITQASLKVIALSTELIITTKPPKKIPHFFHTTKKQYLILIEKSNQLLKENLDSSLSRLTFFNRAILDKLKQQYNFEEFCTKVANNNLTVIWGMGGLGKSILLKRLSLKLIDLYPQACIIYCDAQKWNESYSEYITKDIEIERRITSLLLGFRSNLTLANLKSMRILSDNSVIKYLFIDGLNQISEARLRSEIIDTLFEIHKDYGFKIFVVSRYNNVLEFVDWEFYEVNKISIEELSPIVEEVFNKSIDSYSDRTIEYFRIPYFLHIAQEVQKDTIKSYSSYIYQHTLKDIHSDIKKQALISLSELAFNTYKSPQKFIIKENALTEVIHQLFIRKGILIKNESGYHFEHHLVNEFFVANKIAHTRELWNREIFDLITLENRISFEIIQMVLEQLDSKEEGDDFLLEVYNWNFYAVLHCLENVEDKYSENFAKVLLLVLTEKFFDKFKHTKIKVKKYLSTDLFRKFGIQGIEFDQFDEFVASNPTFETNRKELMKIISDNSDSFQDGKYLEWYQLFSYKEDALTNDIIDKISTPNSIDGWTCSNLLKRYKFTPDIETLLREKYVQNGNQIINWRIIHALGNSTTAESIEFVTNVLLLNNTYIWVKYGAIRSLLEIAFFNLVDQEFETLMNQIVKYFEENDFEKLIVGEFMSCMTSEITKEKHEFVKGIFERIINIDGNSFSDRKNWINAKNKFYENNRIR